MDTAYAVGVNILLRKLSIQKLVKLYRKSTTGALGLTDVMSRDEFVRESMSEYRMYSENECENIYRKLRDASEKEDHGVFSLIMAFAGQMLRLDGNEIQCAHDDLLDWRKAVHTIGQSIFMCAFLAEQDVAARNNRGYFGFSPYVKTDYLRLRNMLSQGMAENHYHLKGSAPAFLLSWVCLMNHITGRRKAFQCREMSRLFFRVPEGDERLPLHEAVELAALIRHCLHQFLNGENAEDIHKKLRGHMMGTPHTWTARLQREMNAERRMTGGKLDYSLDGDQVSGAYASLAGEHRFLYRVFRAIRAERAGMTSFQVPFLIYLLAFVRLRAELIQSNQTVGFQNFLTYQDRKEIFLEGYSAYQQAFLRMAVQSSLANPSVLSLEARFAPKLEYKKMVRDIRNYSKASLPEKERLSPASEKDRLARNERLFFVAHLVKMQDTERAVAKSMIRNRHHARQKEYSKQIKNILRLRNARAEESTAIYGLDACNQEHYARPEVFAWLFRHARYTTSFTRGAQTRETALPKLMLTYHAGEDFYDIVSGLRAVDEAVYFLDMRYGDRLGHALALGVDPGEYYAFKNGRLFLPRQELLDNVAWLDMALKRYTIFDRSLESWIQQMFQEQFLYVYRAAIPYTEKDHSVSIDTYHNAWRLRGDRPGYYKDVTQPSAFTNRLLLAKPEELLGDRHCEAIRASDIQARQLMHYYHYSPEVRRRGAEIYELEIPAAYSPVIHTLQSAMIGTLGRSGIGIETNPSSNYLIGTFRSYQSHPITRFYDKGLTNSPAADPIFVSINTDDQGIFDTDLENEYALMACALQTAKGEDGKHLYDAASVIHWLDDIRKMGLEQSVRLTRQNLGEV